MPKGWASNTGNPRKYRNLTAAIEHLQRKQGSVGLTAGSAPPVTEEERLARQRERKRISRSKAAEGGRQAAFNLSLEAAAALVYLRTNWGFGSTKEAVEVALRHLAAETRQGLTRIQIFDASRDA